MQGGQHEDSRGTLYFVNEFDMSPVKRMYVIEHPNPEIRRGWRAHKLEHRWFHVLEGSFEVNLIEIDDWANPSRDLVLKTFVLSAQKLEVLSVPKGYASGFKALQRNSKFIVYADALIEEAKNDDYQYPIEYFINWR